MTAITTQDIQVPARREYCAPKMIQFGLVSDLTASGSKPGNENGGNRFGNNSNNHP